LIKLLIVDDSALMRRQLTQLFASAGGFDIATARNGREAVELNHSFLPDVVTLDINMPEMDGLTALSEIMVARPVPVVMVSSLTEKGALATFEALGLGAVDFVTKPGGTISLSIDAISAALVSKVRSAARARLRAPRTQALKPAAMALVKTKIAKPIQSSTPTPPSDGVVVIGVSTGGPRTLDEILPALPEDFPWPILVAQHMPASFTKPFAERLNNNAALEVTEVSAPTSIRPGHVYIARGGADMIVTKRAGKAMLVTQPENKEHLWHPSAQLLAQSVLHHYPPKQIVGVMLTGMGSDGAETFTAIKKGGGRTIAEAEESAVVFGMPKELISRGGASLVLPAHKIAGQLTMWASRPKERF
jgi:two-component system chemotaxis response regulator CheB